MTKSLPIHDHEWLYKVNEIWMFKSADKDLENAKNAKSALDIVYNYHIAVNKRNRA